MTTTFFGYQTVIDWLAAGVGLDNVTVEYNPGPPSYEGVADTVGRACVVTVGGGPGLEIEQAFDRVTVDLDVAGDQNDPQSAEDLALALDRRILLLDHTQTVGGVRVLCATRAGGRPTPVGVDDGDRWHLACGYVWRVGSGV